MGLSMKSISKAASNAVDKLSDAASAVEDVARKEAIRAAEQAAIEAQRAAEEMARQLEDERRRLAEELAEQAKQLEDAAKKAAEESQRLALEEAQKAADELKKQAEAFVKDQIKGVLSTLIADLDEFSESGQAFVKQIEAEIQNLIELANIDSLKQKLLSKAEQLSEEYLKNKVEPIAESITLTSVPDVKLDLSTTSIKIQVIIYFLLKDAEDSDPSLHALAVLTADLEQAITKLEPPDVDVLFNYNVERLKTELMDMIKEKIEKEKNNLIRGFLESFFSDYFTVFQKIINLLPK